MADTTSKYEERQRVWRSVLDAMRVSVPEGTSGDVEVRRFSVSREDAAFTSIRAAVQGRGAVRAGEYTGLYRRGYLWMSDTPDEQRDHSFFLSDVFSAGDCRVLVTGLGLGMVAAGLAQIPTVEHVTIVEIDADVIALVGPHLRELFAAVGKTIDIVQGDAKDPKQWLDHTDQWDSAWHDVWAELCTDNLAEMASMSRRYCRRVGRTQGFWGRELLRSQRRREQRYMRFWS